MIVDDESYALVNAIESLLQDSSAASKDGEVKPELMESVLEIATKPCSSTTEAGEQIRALRHSVREMASKRGLAIGFDGAQRRSSQIALDTRRNLERQ